MSHAPTRWQRVELEREALVSETNFRKERLDVSDAWSTHYKDARSKFELLFTKLEQLTAEGLTDETLADAYSAKLGEAMRYLAGPPISDDDLKVIADVESLAPGVLSKDIESLRKVYGVIERVIDPYRFPWVASKSSPDPAQIEAALLASSVLLAGQRLATERRNDGKDAQEGAVKKYLIEIGFAEVAPVSITTLVGGPQRMEFCGECFVGDRKADVVVRLHDTRLMPIECKVSNSARNSVKRLNNDAAAKAEHWLKEFGTIQIVPAALLSGVFNVLNLIQAQERGLALFWGHDLDKLGEFIDSAK